MILAYSRTGTLTIAFYIGDTDKDYCFKLLRSRYNPKSEMGGLYKTNRPIDSIINEKIEDPITKFPTLYHPPSGICVNPDEYLEFLYLTKHL
jgi:hypothetical protein